jgi:hypothetical protein
LIYYTKKLSMKTKLILGIMLLLGLSIGANAQYTRGNDGVQRERISQGRRSGELTKGEAFRLSQGQRHMSRQARRYKHNDGHISRGERRHLRHERRMSSHRIHRYKHNDHRRFN